MMKNSSGSACEGFSSRRQTRQSERLRQKRLRVTGENFENEQKNIEVQTVMEHIGREESESDREAYSVDIPSLLNGRNHSTQVFITNPSGLDCFICYEPLTIPVLECKNGHIVCSSCYVNLKNKWHNKCPLCSDLISKPCRAIENVLKSVQVSCTNTPHGCKEIISYNNKKDHENKCAYTPCHCPHSSCNFAAPPRDLSLHFSTEHGWPVVYFEFGCHFSVSLNNVDHEIIVLKEQNDGNLFILYNNHEDRGNKVFVNYIAPCSSDPAFHYEISSSRGLEMQSEMSNQYGLIEGFPEMWFPHLPSSLFHGGQLKLDLCIWKGGSLELVIDLSDAMH